MFDITNTALSKAVDDGTFMAFLDPSTGEPHRDEKGVPQGVVLRSRLSRPGQQFQRQQADKRLEMARRGQETSVESLEAETTELLVACTVSWTFSHLGGAEFPCNEANARKFWADARFRSHRERANGWIGNEANFTKR
jgi:hypothetical protein